MALGYHRRVYLPIPKFLCLALQDQGKERGRANYARRRKPGINTILPLLILRGQLIVLVDLEHIQRLERALLFDPKIQNQRRFGSRSTGRNA